MTEPPVPIGAVVDAIASALIADVDARATVVGGVVEWLDAQRAQVGDHAAAWAAARTVSDSLAAIGRGAAPALPLDQLGLLASLPVAAQVAAALHHLAGLDVDAVAAATSRPPSEVRHLLGEVRRRATGTPTAPPPPPPPAEAPPPPQAPPTAQAPPSPPAPPAPPPQRPAPDGGMLFGSSDGGTTTPTRHRRRVRRSRRRSTPWLAGGAAAIAALVVGGIVANAMRPDPEPRERVEGEVGGSVTIERSQLSKGCDSPEGDAALEPQVQTLRTAERDRSYRIVAPAPVSPGRPRPLIVAFGDLGQSLDEQVAAAQLDPVAVALTAVVVTVAPAQGYPQWNVTDRVGDPDDIGLTNSIIERESRRLCIDQTRIVVAGQGAGAHFAATYACANREVVSGVVLVAGVHRPARCNLGDGSTSILAVLGSADDVFPLTGGTGDGYERLEAAAGGLNDGARYRVAPALETLDRYAADLDCVGTASMPLGLVAVRIATSCAGTAEVWRVVLDGAGHEWYGATNELILRFMTDEGPLGTR